MTNEKTAGVPAGAAVMEREEPVTDGMVVSGNGALTPFADKALAYAQLGLYVFPVRPRGKEPLTRNGHKDASTDPGVIDAWASNQPAANIGVDTARSGLLVVDCDSQAAIDEARSLGLPATAWARTGKGAHYYYRLPHGTPSGRAIHTGQSGKIDLLADGYAILPDSVHPTGRIYEWVASPFALGGQLPDAPEWVVNTLRDAVEKRGVAQGSAEPAEPIAPSQNVEPPVRLGGPALERWNGTLLVTHDDGTVDRSAHLFALACDLYRAGANRDHIASAIAGWDSRLPTPKFWHRKDRDGRYRETSDRAIADVERNRRGGELFADERIVVEERGSQTGNDATQPPRQRGQIYSAAHLMDLVLPEPKWAVPDVLPEGLSLLVGKPKQGKSWWALGVGIAVASGGMALGCRPVRQGDVLYLALEDNQRRLQDRFRKVLNGAPCPPRFHYSLDWPHLYDGGLGLLETWLTEHPDARLVVVDTLAKVRPPRQRNGDVYQDDYRVVGDLKRLADRYGVGILAVHHQNKSKHEDDLDTVSGSTGVTGAADSTLLLKRERGAQDARLYITGRDVDEQTLSMKWEPQFGLWRLIDEREQVRRRGAEATTMLLAIGKHEPIAPRDLAVVLNKKPEAVRTMLHVLRQEGLSASVSGKAVLTEAGRTEVATLTNAPNITDGAHTANELTVGVRCAPPTPHGEGTVQPGSVSVRCVSPVVPAWSGGVER